MKAKVNKIAIRLVQGDLLAMQVSGIVNSTDTSLTLPPHLADKAGVVVQRQAAEIGWCPVGSAVITDGGGTGFEKIIHAVGPRWGEGSERGKLLQVTFECLNLAEEHKLKSLAIPAISTGAHGYPLENCAKTMLTQIIDYTFEDLKHLRVIVLCLESELAMTTFQSEFAEQLQELKSAGEGQVQV